MSASVAAAAVVSAEVREEAAVVPAGVREEAVALESLLLARAYVYTLFRTLLGAAPDAETLDALLGSATAEAIGAYAEEDETMREFGRFLAGLAAREDRAQLLDEVRDEYTRLFIGPGTVPVPVWESPYRSKEPAVFQENTLAVRAAYRAHGLEPKHVQRVPDDHVAMECSFMAERAGVTLAALRDGDAEAVAAELRDEYAFVEEHLNSWLSIFAKAERSSRTAVLYPQLVEALAAFCQRDAIFLSEAAYWAESLEALLETSDENTFADFKQSLATLKTLHLYGLDDYELVPIK